MPGKRSAAGRYIRHGTRDFAGWRLRLTRPTGSSHRHTPCRPVQSAAPPGDGHQARYPWCLPGWRLRLTRPTGSLSQAHTPVGPVQSRSAAGRISGTVPVMLPGWRLAPYPAYGACDLSLIYSPFLLKLPVLTASKSAETFPEGRGSPHGCGLRAVFCRDAASARPEACRDKSKAPRSGDFAGRSPGDRGRRRLAAPCALPAP